MQVQIRFLFNSAAGENPQIINENGSRVLVRQCVVVAI